MAAFFLSGADLPPILGRMDALRVPPLVAGGIMFSYRCTSTCRHCLYRCSPRQPNEWLTLDMARRIFTALAREPDLDSIHLAGGEPTIHMELLLEVIRLTKEMKIPVAYLETNASWCRNREHTRLAMNRLREAGLSTILISVSMFHNEWVPFFATRNAVETAYTVFGPDHVILYLPHMYEMLGRLPGDGTRRLEEFVRLAGLQNRPEVIPRLYDVIPSGRAPEGLRDYYSLRPAQTFEAQNCRAQLLSTSHFHVDHAGRLFTGMCAGLVVGTVEDFHVPLTPETHPSIGLLSEAGSYGLMQHAVQNHGFQPDERGYVSSCDLCFQVRRFLRKTGHHPDLQPESFYEG